MGVRRYGYHGISYESIIYQLQPNIPEKLIVAHLGNGASITAIRNGKCLDTSMGLTPTGGIISGTRTGDIDPGVVLFILRKIGETTPNAAEAADNSRPFSARSPACSASASSPTTCAICAKPSRKATQERGSPSTSSRGRSAEWIGSFFAELGGLDMLVFTGGIGENDIASRAEICAGLGALGIVLDPERNNVRGEAVISAENSP